MANRAKPVFSDTGGLRCPICLDEYTAPKNLPCLHTYCQHCLHKYIVKNVPKEKVGATFSCPECRKETFPPHPDISIDKWAEHYPNNTVLLSLLPPDKRKVDKSCDSCLYEGNSVSARSYCTVCKESLCATCESVHKKNKISRDHTVINIQGLFTDPELAVNVSVCVTCSEHVGKEFEFYCKSHRSMCCSECFYSSHRGCIEVLQLKDHSERILKEKEANTVVDRLKQLQSHLNEFKNENERSFKKIEAELNTISDEIEEIRKKVNTFLDSVKNRVNMERNTLLKEVSMIQHEENQQCESISSAITNSLHLLETVLAHGNPLHVLTTLHKTEEQLVHYESVVKEKYCEVRRIDTKLCLDDRLLSLIKCSEASIAKIDIVENKHSLTPFLPLAIEKIVNTNVVKQNLPQAEKTVDGHKPTQKSLGSKSLKDCKPDKTGEFNVHYRDGRNPRYTGITCLPDDKIMLVDNANNICRLYDSSYQHLADYKLSSCTWGVCVLEGSQVAVTHPMEKKIQILTVDSSIHLDRIIHTFICCDGIAVLPRDQLVVTGIMKGGLHWCIVSRHGTGKLSIKVCPSVYYSHLTLNNSRTRVYISCYNPGAVYAYSVKGALKFIYDHKALERACGVAVDREDNLYVVDQLSQNVHQVSPIGTPIQVFSTGITNEPYLICFTSSGDEFLLTGNTKIVAKFKLKQSL